MVRIIFSFFHCVKIFKFLKISRYYFYVEECSCFIGGGDQINVKFLTEVRENTSRVSLRLEFWLDNVN